MKVSRMIVTVLLFGLTMGLIEAGALGRGPANATPVALDGWAAPSMKLDWQKRMGEYGMSVSGYSSAYDSAMDSQGNIIVVGEMRNRCTTVKYSPTGEKLWSVQHPAEMSQGSQVVIDSKDNILVVLGYGDLLVKYSPAGEEAWSRQLTDTARALAVDSQDNVFVATDFAEIVTTKYSPSGEALWTKVFTMNGRAAFLRGIASDPQGNVLLTATIGDEFTTIKYSSGGEELWVQRLPDAAETVITGDLGVDAEGNVFVTGSSKNGLEGIDAHITTIKYSPAGEPLWIKHYGFDEHSHSEATRIAIDSHGNAIVTGASSAGTGPARFTTIKYSPSGEEVWVRREDRDPEIYPYSDTPRAVAVTDQGDIYVAGGGNGGTFWSNVGTFYTIKYTASGERLWAREHFGGNIVYNGIYAFAESLSVDKDGNATVVGICADRSSNYREDWGLVKYSSAGEELQVTRTFQRKSTAYAMATAVDQQGNVLVTGEIVRDEQMQTRQTYTAKYSPLKEKLWQTTFYTYWNGWLQDDSDSPVAIAVDSQGNAVVTGITKINHHPYPGKNLPILYTVKYSPEGIELWRAVYDDPLGRYNKVNGMAIDAENNIVLTGKSGGNYTTIKYSPNGEELWAKHYSKDSESPLASDDEASAVAVDSKGNIYVTGSSGVESNHDYATIKYSPAGEQLWVQRYSASPDGDEKGMALTLDPEGYLLVTGTSIWGRNAAYATLKYSPDGALLWARQYRVPIENLCRSHAVKLVTDSKGNAFIGGMLSRNGDKGRNYGILKYSHEGQEQWMRRLKGPGLDVPNTSMDLAVDASDNVFISGLSKEPGDTWYELITARYSSEGIRTWADRRKHCSVDAFPVSLAAGPVGEVIVSGTTQVPHEYLSGYNSLFLTMKYSPAVPQE